MQNFMQKIISVTGNIHLCLELIFLFLYTVDTFLN